MNQVKSITMKDLTSEGEFRRIDKGENGVTVMVLVAAPDGVFYTAEGEHAGRYFLPIHMISAVEMDGEEETPN